MTTYDDHLASLWDLHASRKEWTTERVMIYVQTTYDNPEPMEINLMATVGFGVGKRNTTRADYYWLSPQYCQNDKDFREKELFPFFVC